MRKYRFELIYLCLIFIVIKSDILLVKIEIKSAVRDGHLFDFHFIV